MTDWNAVRADYEKGGSLKDLAQKYGVKANTIKGRRQREKWKRLEINEKKEKTKDISSYKKGFSPIELIKKMGLSLNSIYGNKECHIDERYADLLTIIDVDEIALGIGAKRKITKKYNGSGELISCVVTDIHPTAEERKRAEDLLFRYWNDILEG